MFLVMLVVGGVYYLLRHPRATAVLLVVVNILGRLSTGWPVGYLLSVGREQ